ncbi:MAG: TolB family protein, partial [Anaerolineales bacterium]
MAALVFLGLPLLRPKADPPPAISGPVTSAVRITAKTPTATHTVSAIPTVPQSIPIHVLEITEAAKTPDRTQSLIVLAIQEAAYNHLFAYQPESLQLTRLTNGFWDDITPSISPDQTQVAFASNRDGNWNIYLFDLKSGNITQLTDLPGYKAAPSWSPDGNFLVYEAYVE